MILITILQNVVAYQDTLVNSKSLLNSLTEGHYIEAYGNVEIGITKTSFPILSDISNLIL